MGNHCQKFPLVENRWNFFLEVVKDSLVLVCFGWFCFLFFVFSKREILQLYLVPKVLVGQWQCFLLYSTAFVGLSFQSQWDSGWRRHPLA